jgi:predicted RNase H-like HicB family nuclease
VQESLEAMSQYVAVVEKEADSAFGVWFPDVEGCFSAGESLEEAVGNAALALRQHMEALGSAGQRVPAARGVAEILRDKDVKASVKTEAVLLAVPLFADTGRTTQAG